MATTTQSSAIIQLENLQTLVTNMYESTASYMSGYQALPIIISSHTTISGNLATDCPLFSNSSNYITTFSYNRFTWDPTYPIALVYVADSTTFGKALAPFVILHYTGIMGSANGLRWYTTGPIRDASGNYYSLTITVNPSTLDWACTSSNNYLYTSVNQISTGSSSSVDTSTLVSLTGTQTISGSKTFSNSSNTFTYLPKVTNYSTTPSNNNLVTKYFLDTNYLAKSDISYTVDSTNNLITLTINNS